MHAVNWGGLARGRGRPGKLAMFCAQRPQPAVAPPLQRVADVPEASQTPPPPPASLAGRVAWWLLRFRGPLFLLAVALVGVGVERARHLKFSRSIDAMFDRSDPALVPFARMARTFGGDEVVLCAYDDPDLFTTDGITRLAALTERLAGEPGVHAATSLASTPLQTRSPAPPSAARFLRCLRPICASMWLRWSESWSGTSSR